MNFQDLLAVVDIRQVQYDTSVETTRPEQCLIKNIRAIRCRHHDYVRVAVETVHLNQYLVQGLFAFVMASSQTSTALAPYGINLVNEDNRRSRAFCGLENITHPRGTDSDEHFYEFRCRKVEEGNIAFSCNGAGEKRFPATGWPH